VSCTKETVETWDFSTTTTVETRGSQVERFTLKKIQECVDAWSDKSK